MLKAAFGINDSLMINKFSGSLQSPNDRSKAAYESIQNLLKENDSTAIDKKLAAIVNADYATVAYATAAYLYSDATQKQTLFDMTQQKIAQIPDNESKAVASSKTARYFYRQGKEKQALAVFDQALSTAQNIENQKQRDGVLYLLAMDKARVFLSDNAEQIVAQINDSQLKTALLNNVNNSKAIKGVIGN